MRVATRFLLVLLAPVAAAAFIAVSSSPLPSVVASHFVAGGAANGFMPREIYVALMLALAAGMPLAIALLASAVLAIPQRLLSLPDRDYWLAPERGDAARAFLFWHGVLLGVQLAAFLCFVHWLVVRANLQHPPRFPEALFFPGLTGFAVLLVVWIGALFVRFRRPAGAR